MAAPGPRRRGSTGAGAHSVRPRLVGGLRTSQPWPGDSECTAQTPDGAVALTRDEAQRATTAVALAARNTSARDTSDIDDAVVRALADGPPEDVGPVLHCRSSAAGNFTEQPLTATGLTPRAERVRTWPQLTLTCRSQP